MSLFIFSTYVFKNYSHYFVSQTDKPLIFFEMLQNYYFYLKHFHYKCVRLYLILKKIFVFPI
jgi:oxalate decarboxylase/phosphoglucose isomerase-like protein (cupin superfamily)